MLKVAVIGATGAVGQEFVIGLNKHPWFDLVQVASSERSAGKKYIDALRDPNTSLLKWHNKETIPEKVRDMVINRVEEINPKKVDLIFTALESEDAKMIEPKMASEVPVISTAAAYRYEDDVPILIPGLYDEMVLENVIMTSLQALSGAGRSPGVIALDIMDNVIPYIPKEEEKVQVETKKILGKFDGKSIINANINVSCTCTRDQV